MEKMAKDHSNQLEVMKTVNDKLRQKNKELEQFLQMLQQKHQSMEEVLQQVTTSRDLLKLLAQANLQDRTEASLDHHLIVAPAEEAVPIPNLVQRLCSI